MSLNYTIEETEELKKIISKNYNYTFNKKNGALLRWGRTLEENPIIAPFGPEIAYVDVTDMPMELFTVVVDTISQNQTVVLLCLVGDVDMYNYRMYCDSKGIFSLQFSKVQEDVEYGFFLLYVDNKGNIKPSPDSEDGVNALDVNNFYKEVWHGDVFKTYRWHKMQEMA